MKITNILQAESVIPELQAKDKNAAIRELAQAVTRSEPSIAVDPLYEILLEREKLGSTGIGSGVAIPHGKLPHIEKIIAAFGRSSSGIDFDSQDGEPAHLFFVLVAPENTAGLHLKALAKLSRLLKDDRFREKLLSAKDGAALYQAIAEEDEKV
ncbi:MAG TPA: PTS fructose transporter subunit IIA [Deltaproteobacteria bacterium]|nr:PTS fructose transporter subunit IIA [Deltaproteobacteria bacterium]